MGARAAGPPPPELLVSSSNPLARKFSSGNQRGSSSWIEYAHNGKAAIACRPRREQRAGGGARVACSQFSRRSRRALLLSLNSIDQRRAPADLWAFVTLTYHRADVSPRECKSHLKRFNDRLRRAWGDLAFFWKLEPQKRGTPHLHLLVYVPAGLDHERIRQSIARHWHAVADPDSAEHLRVMEFVGRSQSAKRREFYQPLGSWSQVSGYAAKYCGKPVDHREDWAFPGRFWGIVNRHALPRSIVRVEVSEAAAVWVGRQLKRYIGHLLTGRVDVIANGRRITLHPSLTKIPGYVDTQEAFARSLGGTLKRYRFRPCRSTRNRVGFVPGALVERLTLHAVELFPLGQQEKCDGAKRELDKFMRPFADSARAREKLRASMPRIAAWFARTKRDPFWLRSMHGAAGEGGGSGEASAFGGDACPVDVRSSEASGGHHWLDWV